MRIIEAIRGRGKTPLDPLVVPLGEGEAGPVAWCPAGGSGHLLVSGFTGAGKSVALLTILSHLARHPAAWRVYLIDPRGLEFRSYEKHEAVETVALHPKAAGRVLGEVQAEINRRDSGERPLPRVLVMVDEVVQVLDAGPALREPLASIVERGPAVGVHAVLATQRPDMMALAGMGHVETLAMHPRHLGGLEATYRDSAGEREIEVHWDGSATLDEALGETS